MTMTKIEELKAAYEATTPGEWVVKQEREYKACNSRVLCDKDYTVAQGYSSDSATTKTYNELWAEAEGNTNFIALAHTLMPQLLEAVDLMQEACEYASPLPPELVTKIERILEKLK